MNIADFRANLLKEKAYKSYAKLEDWYEVNRYYLWHMVKNENYVPPDHVLHKLGLPSCSIVVPMAGDVPRGTLVLYALQCECGAWYISNHPRRHKCFVCSPYRRKERKYNG